MKHTLESDKLYMELNVNVFETDINYSSNTILNIIIKCDEFSAQTSMDIDIKEFAVFAEKIYIMYKNLSGTAVVKEPYGNEQFIEFSCDKMGHILIKGFLCNLFDACSYELSFEKIIDQTAIENFTKSFSNFRVKLTTRTLFYFSSYNI